MIPYSKFRPTQFDTAGLALDDRQDWLVCPVGKNRDSDCLERANFYSLGSEIKKLDPEGNDHEEHSFNHWACGHFEILVVRPNSACAKAATDAEERLEEYPILDENLFSTYETAEADEIWKHNFSVSERIKYIRNRGDEFEFQSLADMLGCVRGKYFAGYASELCAR